MIADAILHARQPITTLQKQCKQRGADYIYHINRSQTKVLGELRAMGEKRQDLEKEDVPLLKNLKR
jgi:hypothetical protein